MTVIRPEYVERSVVDATSGAPDTDPAFPQYATSFEFVWSYDTKIPNVASVFRNAPCGMTAINVLPDNPRSAFDNASPPVGYDESYVIVNVRIFLLPSVEAPSVTFATVKPAIRSLLSRARGEPSGPPHKYT
jgi:hypothetical protein